MRQWDLYQVGDRWLLYSAAENRLVPQWTLNTLLTATSWNPWSFRLPRDALLFRFFSRGRTPRHWRDAG